MVLVYCRVLVRCALSTVHSAHWPHLLAAAWLAAAFVTLAAGGKGSARSTLQYKELQLVGSRVPICTAGV